MKSFQELKKLAKALFKKVYKFEGIVTNSIIKKAFPKFKISDREHWELLIFKILGRNKKGDKVIDIRYKQLENCQKSLSQVGLTRYGNIEFFAGCVSLKFVAKDRNSFFKGDLVFSQHKNCWFASVRNQHYQYFRTIADALNWVYGKYNQNLVIAS